MVPSSLSALVPYGVLYRIVSKDGMAGMSLVEQTQEQQNGYNSG